MKIGTKLASAEARLSLLSICLVAAACCLFALAGLSQSADATAINIFKHRYPFYGGYYPSYGGYGGFGGGYGGINIGGFGYGRR